MGRERDHGSVVELHPFAALDFKVDRIHVSFWGKGTIAIPSVDIVGPCLQHVTDWGMVADLLHHHAGTVLKFSLVSFP